MVKIIVPGKLLSTTTRRFKCDNCDCVFDADKDEYSCGSQYSDDYYCCICPCCGYYADEEREE